jgi:hypothetical protein
VRVESLAQGNGGVQERPFRVDQVIACLGGVCLDFAADLGDTAQTSIVGRGCPACAQASQTGVEEFAEAAEAR